LIGQTVSHYEVLSSLGAGGMGEVYRARDTRLGREVALKVLPEGFAGDAGRMSRFVREAQVLASLSHPNIATLHALEESGGRHVLVMEMIEGETLAELLARGPLPVPDALRLAAQIADALQAAHRKNIVHRDLKPANVKVTPEGAVKVLDFGLAKQRPVASDAAVDKEAPTEQVEALTVRGVILGTPAYMSPEQALGEQTDARADVFSFGAVLYEMLTGSRAFRGSTLSTILRGVLSETPPAPRSLRAEIPAELEALVMRALQKEKELRQPSMVEVCSQLSEISARLSSEPARPARVPARRLRDAGGRVRAWATQNPKKAAVALLLPAVVAVGILGATVYMRPGPPAPAAATASSTAAPAADAAPYELLQQGLTLLERSDREEQVEAALKSFQSALSKDGNYAPAYAGLGMAYLAKFQFNRDKQLLEMAVQNAHRAVELDKHLALNHVSLGRAYAERGDYGPAEQELNDALRLEPLNADAHLAMGELQEAQQKLDDAERFYRRASELSSGDWEPPYALGTLYLQQSRYDEAERALKESIRRVPDSHRSRRNLGVVYHLQGRFADAAAEFQQSLRIKPSPGVYTNLGTSLFFQGLYSDSVAAMEKARDLGANNFQMWANLADAYRWTPGRERDAVDAYRRAIQLAREESAGKPDDANLHSRLAVYLAKSSAREQALEEAAAAERAAGGKSAPVLSRLVVAYEVCGRRGKALEAMSAALKAGHSAEEFRLDPELLELRKDPNYHMLIARYTGAPRD
jgi:serine/threonine-protein kinase